MASLSESLPNNQLMPQQTQVWRELEGARKVKRESGPHLPIYAKEKSKNSR